MQERRREPEGRDQAERRGHRVIIMACCTIYNYYSINTILWYVILHTIIVHCILQIFVVSKLLKDIESLKCRYSVVVRVLGSVCEGSRFNPGRCQLHGLGVRHLKVSGEVPSPPEQPQPNGRLSDSNKKDIESLTTEIGSLARRLSLLLCMYKCIYTL